MHTLSRVAIAICACWAANACASAPISMAGAGFIDNEVEIEVSPWQAALHTASAQLEDTFISRGWSSTSDAIHSARRWVGRLTGQETAPEPPAEDPVVTYLAQHRGESAEIIRTHLDEAIALSRDVDVAARSLIQSGGSFSRSSLSRDIETVEAAIGHTRRAADMFDRAIEVVSAELSETQLGELRARHLALAERSEQLSDRADDIADMRWGGVPRLTG